MEEQSEEVRGGRQGKTWGGPWDAGAQFQIFLFSWYMRGEIQKQFCISLDFSFLNKMGVFLKNDIEILTCSTSS